MDEETFYLEDLKSKFRKLKNVGGYDKYYLSYSGGKDSHFLYWFLKEYSYPEFKDIKIVGINTFMEHHEILARILKNSDIVLTPSLKPMEIKEKYGSPCFSKTQDDFIDRYQRGSRSQSTIDRIYCRNKDGSHSMYGVSKKARDLLLSGSLHRVSPKCCKYLKKEVARRYEKENNVKPILGVRGSESLMRNGKYKSCFTSDKKFTPLWDLSDELMNKIYKKYNIELPKVYEYTTRTGCMGCPYGSYKHDTEKELMLINNAQFNFVTEYFKESYEVLGIDIDRIREERGNL